jgi:hypothetical protein
MEAQAKLNMLGLTLRNAGARAQEALTIVARELRDPEDRKILVDQLDLQGLHSRIEIERANGAVLQADLERASMVAGEIGEWLSALENILPQAELSKRAATRLNGMIHERGAEKSAPAEEATLQSDPTRMATNPVIVKAEKGKNRKKNENHPLPSFLAPPVFVASREGATAPAPQIISLSQGAEEIVKMAQKRVLPGVIITYVRASRTPFMVRTADQILLLRAEGVPEEVIREMLRRDGAFLAK